MAPTPKQKNLLGKDYLEDKILPVPVCEGAQITFRISSSLIQGFYTSSKELKGTNEQD